MLHPQRELRDMQDGTFFYIETTLPGDVNNTNKWKFVSVDIH